MLKTCNLPTFYPNLTNKPCGEIFCQTETAFFIICKLCDIKIFEYEEFIKHFCTTHWTEICKDGDNVAQSKRLSNVKFSCERKSDNQSSKINTKNENLKNTNEFEEQCQVNELRKQDDVSSDGSFNVQSDEDDLSHSVAILKKKSEKSAEISKAKDFECVQCKRKFTTKFYLRYHMRQQHEPKTFQCDKCSKSFVEKRYLSLHLRSHNGYTCQICQKVFDKYEALRYHGESHIETRNFLCDYENCGKAFPNNRRLSAHKRSHFAQPSFVCEICGSRQRSNEFLIVHIRTHTGEKPYACEHCDRRFASKHFLQDHQSVHATERSHVCRVCGKAFASSKSLYHHRHLHSDIKKYVCKICNSAYSQAAGLSAHMRKHKQDSGLLDSEQINIGDNTLLC